MVEKSYSFKWSRFNLSLEVIKMNNSAKNQAYPQLQKFLDKFTEVSVQIGNQVHFSVLIPWTTPPLLSGLLASAGDWKVVLVQIIILIICTLFYIPFIKISERVALKQAERL